MSRLSLVVAGLGLCPEVAHAYGDGYSTQGYDCASGYSNWRNGWADGKKAWCCQQRGLGCPNVNYPDSYPGSFPSEYRDVHPEYAPAPTIVDGSYRGSTISDDDRGRGDTYDCQAGFQNWKVGWSARKQSYCCQSVGLGCPRVNYPDTYPGAFPPAYQEAYPDEYQHHIHHIHHYRSDTYQSSRRGDPYDCEAGLDSWGVTWSTSKKAWCCDNFHRGCARHQDHYVVHRQNNYVEHYNEPVDNVHVHYDHHRMARNEPYNCQNDYANWEGEWPASKKAWCCEYYQRGCVRVQHDQYIVHHQHREYYNDDGRQYYNKVEERSGAVAQQSAEQAPRVFGVMPIFGVVGGMTLALIALAVRSRRTLQPRLPNEDEELLTDMIAVE